MKKVLTGSIVLSAVLTLPAMAAYNGVGMASQSIAADASKASDDTPVELTGYLVQSLGDEKYLFRDANSDVEIAIDNALWREMDVSSDSKVTLIGEVDDQWQGIEIEIDSMRLVSQ